MAMAPEVRAQRIAELVDATRGKPNGEISAINEQIRNFERRYETSSASLRSELTAGKRHETAEICQWLMLLKLRDRLAAVETRSSKT